MIGVRNAARLSSPTESKRHPKAMTRSFSLDRKKIWVAGHAGMVGSALLRRLRRESCDVLTVGREECDLRDPGAVGQWMERHRPDVVILAAARVGGIVANARYPADFLYDNMMIAANVIEASRRFGVEKLLYLGSSCIYPKHAPQPIPEEALLTGALEPTNEAYAVAKVAGVKLCQAYRAQHGCDFIAAMPCNLYGPGDRYNPEYAHVVPALILKGLCARAQGLPAIALMGTGSALREFMHVDDLADALCFLLGNYSEHLPINVGSGTEISIAELAALIGRAVGFEGEIVFTGQGPDGTPRKIMDTNRLRALGWQPSIGMAEGLRRTLAHERGRLERLVRQWPPDAIMGRAGAVFQGAECAPAPAPRSARCRKAATT